MQVLLITEKPSVAKDIAPHLGKVTAKPGEWIEIDGGAKIVTWCIGHITELLDADVYLPEDIPRTAAGKKKWRKQDLPIIPQRWQVGVTEKKRFEVIRSLLAKAQAANAEIWHGGDPDREGQLLVDRVLELCRVDPNAPNVRRILPAALDDASIKKFLAAIQPNRNFANLRAAAKARSFADWLVGINGTRKITLDNGVTIPIGRVMTPTAALVVRRDREIRNFVPKQFYVPYVIMPDGTRLTWSGRKDLVPGIDSDGRIVDKALANRILKEAIEGAWRVEDAQSKEVRSAPPNPHNLSSLQQQLSRTHRYSAAQTLEVAQSLYENHKLATYPRTDCRFLPQSQFGDRQGVLRAVADFLPKEVNGANADLESRAWDDKKVTAHHAIVPTGKSPAGISLTAMERVAYEAIARQYVAQFYPDALHQQSNLAVEFNEMDMFKASSKVLVNPGWMAVLGGVKQTAVAGESLENELDQDEGVDVEQGQQRARPEHNPTDRDFDEQRDRDRGMDSGRR